MVKFKDECLERNTVVHLRTQEQADTFSIWLDSRGKEWRKQVRYTDESEWYFYKEDTCYHPYKESYGDIDFYKDEGYKILSYEEALLEEKEYSLPVIDLTKCKKYHVWNDEGEKDENIIRCGVYIMNNILYCLNEYENRNLSTLKPNDLISWKHWEEVKEDTKDKEIKDQIAKLKAEIEKLEGMCSSTK